MIIELYYLMLLLCEISPLLLGIVALRMSNLQVIESRLLVFAVVSDLPH